MADKNPVINLIKLTQPETGQKIYVNCDKVLYLTEDNNTQMSLCVIHMHGGATTMVKEGIHGVAAMLKCPPEGH